MMRSAHTVCLVWLFLMSGCAATRVSDSQILYSGQLPKPGRVWVYKFAATPGEIPSDSAVSGQLTAQASALTEDQIAVGRRLGGEMATKLTGAIMAMGLPASVAQPWTKPQVNDLVIRGYFLSVDQGNAAARIGVGFGVGGSEVKTLVEVYQMTPAGLRKLGSGVANASGNQTPGAGLGLAGLLATGNPVGLIVSGGMKAYGEENGSSTVEGRTGQTAQEIASRLKSRFIEQNWISG